MSTIRPATLATTPEFNRRERNARLVNNLVVHIALNDTPALLSLANVVDDLPPLAARGLEVLNGLNFVTGCVGLAMSAREVRGTFRNPLATRLDKAVGVGHLILSDIVATGGSLLPFAASLTGHPLSAAVFVGTQLAGVVADGVKTLYDLHRGGQQSAWREGQTAVDGRAPALPPVHAPRTLFSGTFETLALPCRRPA